MIETFLEILHNEISETNFGSYDKDDETNQISSNFTGASNNKQIESGLFEKDKLSIPKCSGDRMCGSAIRVHWVIALLIIMVGSTCAQERPPRQEG